MIFYSAKIKPTIIKETALLYTKFLRILSRRSLIEKKKTEKLIFYTEFFTAAYFFNAGVGDADDKRIFLGGRNQPFIFQ